MKQIAKKVLIINLIVIILLGFISLSFAQAAERSDLISNCGHGEEGHEASGGKPGDQEGDEYHIIPWYNFSINHVLRYKDPEVAKTFAELAIEAANNNMIGYDQDDRTTFWQQLKISNYRPSEITTRCEADCSSSTVAIVKAAGHILNIPELENLSEELYTGSMLDPFVSAGFTDFTDSSYTNGPDKLETGDILLNTSLHATIFIGDGEGGSVGKFPIDDVTINLDEQEFEFAGTPQTVTYAGHITPGEWIFTKVSQFVDFIVAIITNGIKMSVLGWAMSIEGAFDSSIKLVEGN